MRKQIKFPEKFYWGAAISSHQVEGNNHNDWSEWEKSAKRITFLRSKGLIEKYGLDNFISGRAADHYNRFREDFEIAKELGHNATRFSIEWSRIEPEEGKFDEKEIEHYKNVINVLKELEIEPFITLWHWTIPIWLRNKGGWQSNKISDYFVRYSKKLVEAFGKDIQFYITLNEPEIYASNSYFLGIWPPQKKNIFTYLRVFHNLIKAHRKAYKAIKKVNPEAKIGIAKNNIYFEAYQNKLVNWILKKLADWWWNFYFLNRIKNYQDFIGLNHYFYNRINYGFNKNENKKVSDMGWELYPEAIYYVLKDLKRFDKPIYITENGIADAKDEKRAWFIFESLRNISQAIDNGVDVRGYLHWSLMDNFEWDKGFWPRFGLLEINYKTLERKIRPSAKFYRDICLANGVTEDILEKYRELIEL
ncbi:MAG: glycoside hydrolase family 1 protein [Patescibacteria group bacterium]|nr:glycoside hydrolase family 1 protein [Patescibacteria group bacterium]